MTEDDYVAGGLMKGFIGSANIVTDSRLCISSAVDAYKRALGSDTVPIACEDLDDADPVICSCFSAGIDTLTRAIRDRGPDTPEAIGRSLNAGTNFGSRVPRLRRLIADVRVAGDA